MGLYFGTDGIRGVVNRQLTPDVAFRCGNALARMGAKKILVGRDTRRSGDMLSQMLAGGALAGGCDVLDAGVVPTPAVAYLAKTFGCRFGVVISASHNPPQFNGIKVFSSSGVKLCDEDEDAVEKFMAQTLLADVTGRYFKTSSAKTYINFLTNSIEGSLEGLKLVLDCANGATCKTAPKVFSALGAKVVCVCCEGDGDKINRCCGALHPQRAAQKVAECGADAAFCFDGDGDRLIAVDEKGGVVNGDKILCILAVREKAARRLEGDLAVGTSHTNAGAEAYLAKRGITLARADIGDKYVNAMMTAKHAALGGEQSGHVIIRRLLSTGDGVLTALQLAQEIKKQKLSVLADIETYPQINLDLTVADKMLAINHEDLWRTVAKLNEGFDGRILVRASGTEPKIRIMAECRDEKKAQEVANAIAQVIKNI